MAITTIAEYKVWNPNAASAASDAALTVLVGAAQAAMERFAGVTAFTADDYTEKLDGTGTESIRVRNPPINTLASIEVLDDDGTTVNETLDTDTYKIDSSANGVINRVPFGHSSRIGLDSFGLTGRAWSPPSIFPEGRDNIYVTYNGGFATVPEDLKLACWRVVDALLSDRGADPSMQSETLGSYAYTRMQREDDPVMSLVRDLVMPFKRCPL